MKVKVFKESCIYNKIDTRELNLLSKKLKGIIDKIEQKGLSILVGSGVVEIIGKESSVISMFYGKADACADPGVFYDGQGIPRFETCTIS